LLERGIYFEKNIMKIGVWANEPIDKSSGGSYTYINTLITAIDNFNFNSNVEIVFLSINVNTLSNFNKPFICIKPHQQGISFFLKVIRRLLKLISVEVFKNLINFIDQKEKKIKDASDVAYLKKQGIKIIFYPMPSSHVINGIPYIVNNWDLAHFTTYAFPEFADDNGFQRRNSWYTEIMTGALMIFTETEAGKNEIVKYLNFNIDKIKVLPIFTSGLLINMQVSDEDQVDILENLELQSQKFFFYPAQFWAHKNHFNLITSFKNFNQQYPDFKLLFCGSDKGNAAYIKNHVKSLNLENAVIFGGFIQDNALYTLYKHAKALVMPTFLGPSNIPPIEALQLGCPVLCSDLEGHREILKDAALYFDPLDDLSMTRSMQLIMDDSIRMQLQQSQKHLSKITDHTIEKAVTKLNEHFIYVTKIRSCWE
jgi:glycosyltransferase involved in cell wall biosynthesis